MEPPIAESYPIPELLPLTDEELKAAARHPESTAEYEGDLDQ
ncbi:MAG: hypothetical protein OXF75_10370 [Acidimicrobiaceae bacterium]|nr:hypothetical protein [Acidimicrobiaceae bacterium]